MALTYRKKNKLCSVVIPTKNGGELFIHLLNGLKAQSYWNRVELIIVDSGSTDGTLKAAQKFGAKIFEIPSHEFNHGNTRDYGISKASCEVVVLMVQDAVPNDSSLLEIIYQRFSDAEVAGVYVRQIPQLNANLLIKNRLNNWVTGRTVSETKKIKSLNWYESLSAMEKFLLCSFDNVCSAIRKSVWKNHKFGFTSFGEDIDWAERVLKTGFKISYEASVAVIHSHDRSLSYEFKRTYICHRKLFKQFNLQLVPTLRQGFYSWLYITLKDMSYVFKQKEPYRTKLYLLAKIPLINFLSAAAQYLAARDEAAGKCRVFQGI
jgi:rhamnosyltransferase